MLLFQYVEGKVNSKMEKYHNQPVIIWSVGTNTYLIEFVDKIDEYNSSMIFVPKECVVNKENSNLLV